jgi:steroid delta-isomerase-like uncharacterized protein
MPQIDRIGSIASFAQTRRRLLGSAAGGLATLAVSGLPSSIVRAQEGTPVSDDCQPPTTEESIAIARAYVDAFNSGDAEALGEVLAPEYQHHGALVAQQDREIHMERLRTNHEAFPDGHYEIQNITGNGDIVAVRTIFTGTLQGPYAGVEPQGQPVAVRAVHIHRIACNQIVETWNSGDGLGLLRQIGALPADGPAPRTQVDSAATPVTATPVAADCPPATAEEHEAIARRWTEEALDQHNLDLLDEFVAEDLVHHSGIYVDSVGRDELKRNLAALLEAFPDARFSVEVAVADEQGAVARWRAEGTHDGDFQGHPPTGVSVTFTGINSYRIVCGQIVEGWSEVDSLGLLRQLELIPAVTPAPIATPVN